MDAIDNTRFEGLSTSNNVNKGPSQLGQDEFLQLMVAQIRHQDPFEPMQNGEFIAQLAQFGTVSGIQELQSSFTDLSQSLISNQSLQASSIIGRDVRLMADSFELDDQASVNGAIDLPIRSESTVVRITDATGSLVKQIELGVTAPGQTTFSWDGMLSNGTRAPVGRYSIDAESVIGGRSVGTEVLLEVAVDSITFGGGRDRQLLLNLENGSQINFEDVSQIL